MAEVRFSIDCGFGGPAAYEHTSHTVKNMLSVYVASKEKKHRPEHRMGFKCLTKGFLPVLVLLGHSLTNGFDHSRHSHQVS